MRRHVHELRQYFKRKRRREKKRKIGKRSTREFEPALPMNGSRLTSCVNPERIQSNENNRVLRTREKAKEKRNEKRKNETKRRRRNEEERSEKQEVFDPQDLSRRCQ
jgi:hypothetical protein